MSILSRAKSALRDPASALVKVLNVFYAKSAKGDKRPAFYDIDKTYPKFRILDRGYQEIRTELEVLLERKDALPRYHDLLKSETYVSGTVDADKDWKVFMLHTPMGIPRWNQAKCPLTTELINQIPNLFQAFFSILDPGKSIPAHCGPYLGYLRYHLGLIVPKINPPRMRVGAEWHTWEEGKSIMFDDSLNHEVVNHSDTVRVVLIVDVLRPMPLPLHAANWAVSRLLFRRTTEGRKALAKIKQYTWH